jgi:serine/threonine protein kinase
MPDDFTEMPTERQDATPKESSAILRWGHPGFPSAIELSNEIHGYSVEKFLGIGGMGAVYLGRQLNLDRPVAIKLLNLQLSQDSEFAERFAREAKAMAMLDHPNIVKVLEFGSTKQGHLFYTMEYLEGGDLLSLLRKKGPLDGPAATALMIQICGALHCSHVEGIVHRDVKPANILLTRAGVPKVADFGLVRGSTGGHNSDLTVTGMVLGTPEYMAPEQRSGQVVDARADVYALGVLLYQLMTGRLPRGAWDPPSEVCAARGAGADVRLDRIVRTALQEDPNARFLTASAMEEALSSLSPQVVEKSGRAAPGLVACALAVLMLGGIGWLLGKTLAVQDLTSHARAALLGWVAPLDRVQEISIMDISRLKPRTQPGGPGTVNATPRDTLLEILRSLVKARPKAIGVDIDFSPHEKANDKPFTPEDPEFFRQVMQLRDASGVAIFLGVWRQELNGKDRWLGGAEFSSLAAGLGIDREEDRPVETLPLEIISQQDGSALPSMSLALAKAGGVYPPDTQTNPWLWRRHTGEQVVRGSVLHDYVVNFAGLDSLIGQRTNGSSAEEIAAQPERVKGKLVLLSDADLSQRADPFTVPTRRNEPIPGGYVHGCGVATLVSGAPSVLTPMGRALAGVGFLGLIGLGAWLIERWLALRRPLVNVPRARQVLRWVSVTLGVVLLCITLRIARLSWLDWLYLSLGLWMLRPLAERLTQAGQLLLTAWRKLLYGEG